MRGVANEARKLAATLEMVCAFPVIDWKLGLIRIKTPRGRRSRSTTAANYNSLVALRKPTRHHIAHISLQGASSPS
jgi:hypothetical protein